MLSGWYSELSEGIYLMLTKLFFLLTALIIFNSSPAWGQWPLWGNLTLPVGSAIEGIGLRKDQILIGSAGTYTYASELIGKNNNSAEEEHSGSLNITEFNLFTGYGLSSLINLYANLPIKRISQNPAIEDSHHRTESLTGIGDIRLSLKWVIRNQYFGPGWRLFFASDLVVPTGDSFNGNPFSESADSTGHRHFALGNGTKSADISFEAWHRSEFPFIMGATIRHGIYSSTSDVGYNPGLNTKIVIHAIRQREFFKNVFPYLKLSTRFDRKDEWDKINPPNSGGTFIDGMLGCNLEINEKVSGIINFDFPIWKSATGEQLDSFRFVLSFRRIINWMDKWLMSSHKTKKGEK